MGMQSALHAAVAIGSIFGANSCNNVLSHNDIHIGTSTDKRHVKLMHIADSRLNKHAVGLFGMSEKDYSAGIKPFVSSASSADLGMGIVPVLDQGEQGTCVTFSSTAALDALLQLDISQQCSLALDMGLGQNWWDGADYPSEIIDPLRKYGVVQQDSCPYFYPDTSASLPIQQYAAVIDKYGSDLIVKAQYEYHNVPDLNVVKGALKAGKRVLMAFTLDDSSQEAVQGFDVKIGEYQNVGGLWACKQKSSAQHCIKSNAGHEVLIIGFDDAQQLLKIRNSWGPSVGDSGDFYMTYTFFSKMAVDLTVVYK